MPSSRGWELSGGPGRGHRLGPEKSTGADPSCWAAQQGAEPAGEEPAVLASPEVCLVQNRHGPSGWTLQDTCPCGRQTLWLWSLTYVPQPSGQGTAAQSCGDTPGRHVGPGHCDLSCSTHRGGHPAPPWPVICTGQGPSSGGWEKNTLASSIMSAKRAGLKKNLVKETELTMEGL